MSISPQKRSSSLALANAEAGSGTRARAPTDAAALSTAAPNAASSSAPAAPWPSPLGLAPVAGFLPLVVQKNGRDDHGADAKETDLQIAHVQAAAGSSRSFRASSISTATTRDTPRSCIVTPTSWCAISMVILLWLM